PASRIMISPSALTSTQLVFPPNRTVVGPGAGMEPRTPHSRTRVGCRSVETDVGEEGVIGIFGKRRSIVFESVSHVTGLIRYASAPASNADVRSTSKSRPVTTTILAG